MKIGLVDTGGIDIFEDHLQFGQNSISLTTLEAVIDEIGGHKVCYLPDHSRPVRIASDKKIRQLTIAAAKKERPDVIFVSSTSEFLDDAIDLAKTLKTPDNKIILGGKAVSQLELINSNGSVPLEVSSPVRQPLSYAFSRAGGAIDFGYIGPAGNLANLLDLLSGQTQELKNGVFQVSGNHILGTGKGEQLPDSIIPMGVIYYRQGELATLQMLVRDVCGHGCSYCDALTGQPRRLSVDLGSRILKRMEDFDMQHVLYIHFGDSSISVNEIDTYRDIVNQIRRVYPNRLYGFYIDTFCLKESGATDYIIHALDSADVGQLNLARDTVSATVAEQLGRNGFGSPRSQTQLDTEGEQIAKFIRKLGFPTQIGVHYIISPWDTSETFKRVAKEARFYHGVAKEAGTELHIKFFPLTPHPATPIAHMNLGYQDNVRHYKNPKTFWPPDFIVRSIYRELNSLIGPLNAASHKRYLEMLEGQIKMMRALKL